MRASEFVACPRCARLLFPINGMFPLHGRPTTPRPGHPGELPPREPVWCVASDTEVGAPW